MCVRKLYFNTNWTSNIEMFWSLDAEQKASFRNKQRKPLDSFFVGFLKGGCSRGGCNWGTLTIPIGGLGEP